MTITTQPTPSSTANRSRPGRAVTALAFRQVRRGAALVGGISAGVTAVVAVQYQRTLAGTAQVRSLQVLAEPGHLRLVRTAAGAGRRGRVHGVAHGQMAAVLVGAWAIAAATRVTRGEKDAGRWALLLAGPVTVPAVVARHLLVLLAIQAAIGTAVALALLAPEAGAGGAVLHGAGIGAVGAFFAAAGVLAAQVLPERRSAAAAAAGVLVATLLMRMVADGVAALWWLAWLSPFGLLGGADVFSGDEALPLVVLLG